MTACASKDTVILLGNTARAKSIHPSKIDGYDASLFFVFASPYVLIPISCGISSSF